MVWMKVNWVKLTSSVALLYPHTQQNRNNCHYQEVEYHAYYTYSHSIGRFIYVFALKFIRVLVNKFSIQCIIWRDNQIHLYLVIYFCLISHSVFRLKLNMETCKMVYYLWKHDIIWHDMIFLKYSLNITICPTFWNSM